MFEWFQNFFEKKTKSVLGVDLGTSTIKIVEVSENAGKKKLETYGLASFSTEGLLSGAFTSFMEEGASEKSLEKAAGNMGDQVESLAIENLSNRQIGQIIKELALQSNVKTKTAYFSIPTYATFSTVISLPLESSEEIAAAIPYEAKKYIPVPMEDVLLDWVIIKKTPLEPTAGSTPEAGAKASEASEGLGIQVRTSAQPPETEPEGNDGKKQGTTNVLLVAILKEVVEKYTEIAQIANLNARIMEAENFCLARAFAFSAGQRAIIIDAGDKFIDLTLVEDGMIRITHNVAGAIEEKSKEIIEKNLAAEIEKVLALNKRNFSDDDFVERKITFVLAGGRTLSQDLSFLKNRFSAEMIIGNPFSSLEYQKVLEPVLGELGPFLAIAAGMAMR
jgi:type IV pilus assembly protein PilM